MALFSVNDLLENTDCDVKTLTRLAKKAVLFANSSVKRLVLESPLPKDDN